MIIFAKFPNVKLTMFKIYAHKLLLNRSPPVSYEVFLLEEKLKKDLHYILDPNSGTGDDSFKLLYQRTNLKSSHDAHEYTKQYTNGRKFIVNFKDKN